MKIRHVVWVILGLAVLLAGCQLENPWLGSPSGGSLALPPDQVADVARSYSGTFTYETLLPVDLNLEVQLYERTAESLQALPSEEQLVIVSLTDTKGNAVYSGRISPAGTFAARLALPAAPEDVVLTLEAPGFETRSVTVRNMVQLAAVNRTMSMLRDAVRPKGLPLPDTDGDGIPDVYDAYPTDPDVAFTVRNPAEGSLTVAFEDLYPVPGDADYNDFVAKYVVVEKYKNAATSEEGKEVEKVDKYKVTKEAKLKSLQGECWAVAKVAGYDHRFGIVIHFPGITPEKISLLSYDAEGNAVSSEPTPQPDRAVLWLFQNTAKALGKKAEFEITFPDGTLNSQVSQAPYDPVLQVIQRDPARRYDVHLIGRDPLEGSVDPPPADPDLPTFLDGNGYPWGLLVPDDWKHPDETQYIGEAYPLFDAWRSKKGSDFSYWYLYPSGTNTKEGNLPPYPVTGPSTTPVFTAGEPATFQLDIDAPSGAPDDPNGNDQVFFKGSPAPPELAEPTALVSLDEDTGLVSFEAGVPAGTYLMYFWSQDQWGASTIDKPYKVSFTFEPAAAYPRLVIDTYPPIIGGVTNTVLELFGAAGDADGGNPWTESDMVPGEALAWDDNGNPDHTFFSRISLDKLLDPGTYYIRVRGSSEGISGPYVLRIVELAAGQALPGYIYPNTIADPDPFEDDDDPAADWGMISANVPDIQIGNASYLNRFLDYDSANGQGDVDWFRLVVAP